MDSFPGDACDRQRSGAVPASCLAAQDYIQTFLLERTKVQPSEDRRCVELYNLGIFSELNRVAKELVRSGGYEQSVCFKLGRRSTRESRKSTGKFYNLDENFRKAHNCKSLACYFTFFDMAECDREQNCSKINKPVNITRLRYTTGSQLSDLNLRAQASKVIFTPTSYVKKQWLQHWKNTFSQNYFTDYIAVHVRWSDALGLETYAKVDIVHYINAAERLAKEMDVSSILFQTSDPRAILALKDYLNQDRFHKDQFTFIVPPLQPAEVPGSIQYIVDFILISSGKGAIVTYSSNLARFLRCYKHDAVQQGKFTIVSLDSSRFNAGND